MTVKSLLSDFAKTTTGHGWGNVHERKSMCTKVAWLIFCIASTLASVGHVTSIIYRYSLFETKDRVLVQRQDLLFPSVTICPLTQMSKQGVVKFAQDTTDEDETVLSISALQLFLIDMVQIDKNLSLLNEVSSERQQFYEKFYNRLYTYEGFYENIPTITKYGHKKHDFISSCMYQGKYCSDGDIHSVIHSHYYNCFTFNDINTTLSNPYSNTTGPTGGLSLQLFLDIDENIYAIYNPEYPTSGSQGVRVVIHEKGTLPDPENEGFEIEQGHSANVALSVTRRELMKPPWGDCTEHPLLDEDGFTFNTRACQMRCLQKMVYKSCGCKRGSLPMYPDVENVQFCDKIQINEWLDENPNTTALLNDLEKLQCSMTEYDWDVVLGQDHCQCKDNCSYNTYDMTLSQSQWPKQGVELDFYCRKIIHLPNYNNSSVYKAFHDQMEPLCTNMYSNSTYTKWNEVKQEVGDRLRENFIRLNVYFKDLETKIIRQEPDFALGSMISEIGGSLGIFIGVSIITIAEVFILCLSIIRVLGKKSKVMSIQDPNGVNHEKQWP
ncbi:unnamed protein product [Owenia fusiformis]|uniref:Uncharacterized protein n=1 Tax=Owenia fusiformis TaxID=6347 RepID=A0A8J1TYQ0_OWEFU|nr:unnamed protein product [Owenia fusiformis]